MPLFLAVLLMEILSGAELDLFVPSFPDIQRQFSLSTFQVESLLSINLLAHCISSLVVGNLGDRFGRKDLILSGLIIFLLSTIMCIFAQNYTILLLGRFLQGVGVAAVAVLGYLLIADNYSVKQQQSMMGVLNGSTTLAMACAPVVGSYIDLFFTWRGNFIFLLILGIICLFLVIFLVPKGKQNPDIKLSIYEYKDILMSKTAMLYIITICFITQPYWVFLGIAPVLYITDLNVPLEHFGLYQGALSLIFCTTSFANGFLFLKFGTKKCFYFSVYCCAIFVILSTILIVFNINNPIAITFVTLFMSLGCIFPITILWPLMLESVSGAKARITAVASAARLIVSAAGIQIVSFFYSGNYTILGMVLNFTVIISIILVLKLEKYDKVFEKSCQ